MENMTTLCRDVIEGRERWKAQSGSEWEPQKYMQYLAARAKLRDALLNSVINLRVAPVIDDKDGLDNTASAVAFLLSLKG